MFMVLLLKVIQRRICSTTHVITKCENFVSLQILFCLWSFHQHIASIMKLLLALLFITAVVIFRRVLVYFKLLHWFFKESAYKIHEFIYTSNPKYMNFTGSVDVDSEGSMVFNFKLHFFTNVSKVMVTLKKNVSDFLLNQNLKNFRALWMFAIKINLMTNIFQKLLIQNLTFVNLEHQHLIFASGCF